MAIYHEYQECTAGPESERRAQLDAMRFHLERCASVAQSAGVVAEVRELFAEGFRGDPLESETEAASFTF
jgi:hypothetical protein